MIRIAKLATSIIRDAFENREADIMSVPYIGDATTETGQSEP